MTRFLFATQDKVTLYRNVNKVRSRVWLKTRLCFVWMVRGGISQSTYSQPSQNICSEWHWVVGNVPKVRTAATTTWRIIQIWTIHTSAALMYILSSTSSWELTCSGDQCTQSVISCRVTTKGYIALTAAQKRLGNVAKGQKLTAAKTLTC